MRRTETPARRREHLVYSTHQGSLHLFRAYHPDMEFFFATDSLGDGLYVEMTGEGRRYGYGCKTLLDGDRFKARTQGQFKQKLRAFLALSALPGEPRTLL